MTLNKDPWKKVILTLCQFALAHHTHIQPIGHSTNMTDSNSSFFSKATARHKALSAKFAIASLASNSSNDSDTNIAHNIITRSLGSAATAAQNEVVTSMDEVHVVSLVFGPDKAYVVPICGKPVYCRRRHKELISKWQKKAHVGNIQGAHSAFDVRGQWTLILKAMMAHGILGKRQLLKCPTTTSVAPAHEASFTWAYPLMASMTQFKSNFEACHAHGSLTHEAAQPSIVDYLIAV